LVASGRAVGPACPVPAPADAGGAIAGSPSGWQPSTWANAARPVSLCMSRAGSEYPHRRWRRWGWGGGWGGEGRRGAGRCCSRRLRGTCSGGTWSPSCRCTCRCGRRCMRPLRPTLCAHSFSAADAVRPLLLCGRRCAPTASLRPALHAHTPSLALVPAGPGTVLPCALVPAPSSSCALSTRSSLPAR
jgi:hypothetical protein